MKISVITPVLNGERFLRQTIESVLAQTGDFELEYIIKDGGSIDGTLAILDEYSKHPAITVISKKDKSLYDAINQGFELASGDIGCWINADDTYEPDTFQNVVTLFKRHPGKQWIYGRCDIINEAGNEIRKPITWYKNLIGWFYSYQILLCENYVNQPAAFWKIDLWHKVDGLSMKYRIAADYHLWIKFAQISKAIALHKKIAHFRRCGESISDNQFESQFQEELEIAKLFCGKITYAIHQLNCWKIVITYKILSKI